MAASTFLVALVLGYTSKHLIEPRFGKYEAKELEAVQDLTEAEKKGLHRAGWVSLVYVAAIEWASLPASCPRTGTPWWAPCC